MIKFINFINKSSTIRFSFNYDDDDAQYNFEGNTKKEIFIKVVDWLSEMDYEFNNKTGQTYYPNIVDEITTGQRITHYYKIPSNNKYIDINFIKQFQSLISLLKDFGIDSKSVKFGNSEKHESSKMNIMNKKMTFINAAQLILKENDNRPMSANEIWDIIDDRDLVETKGATPWMTLNAQMLSYSDNTNIFRKKKVKLFTIVENNPAKFKLINDDIVNIDDEIEDDFSDLDQIKPFSKFNKSNFKASQSQEEKETKEYVKNPFRQAICVLGKSGKGKSTTIEKILKSFGEKMDYEFIIPTASTTNLLSQYSPGSNRYIQSRLGKLIMEAKRNPNKLFTAVFDECHKANVIEMINDELLQSISLYRNLEKRFISVDDDTAILYKGLDVDRGNLLIPNNFGFIFLSSKPNIIIDNADFFNRVDIYVLENQPDKDAVDLYTVIGSSITLSSKYFRSIGDKKTGSKTDSDIDLIKELHK